MEKRKRMLYPIGIQNFEDLRRKGFVYVDKTAHVFDLADTGKYYFLGRPRRFGKSLLISTMEAYFLGKRELFKGLAMEELEEEWNVYPVLHLDLNTGTYDSVQSLTDLLNKCLVQWEKIYGTDASETSPSLRFMGIIQRAFEKTGMQAVILIDEYDKPLLMNFNNPGLQDELRKELKAFYSVLKTQDQYIRFAFLTGVTKFGKVSVFSDLNNLQDISMSANYADICGITEKEIHQYFEPSIHELAEARGMTYEQALARLKLQYDGYHFEHDTPGVYNPFSLLNTLKEKAFKDYWFETGTPTYLVDMLQTSGWDVSRLRNEELPAMHIKSIDMAPRNPVPLLYQSGYLTIKGYDEEFQTYRLGFPNKEVENGFAMFLLSCYMPVSDGDTEFGASKFVREIRSGDVDGFMSRLQTFFDACHYRVAVKKEADFQSAIFIIFTVFGMYVEVEHASSRGCVDIVMKTSDYVYIIECKYDGTVSDALRQIETKGYAAPFARDRRTIYKIGVSFSSGRRTISEWKVAE